MVNQNFGKYKKESEETQDSNMTSHSVDSGRLKYILL